MVSALYAFPGDAEAESWFGQQRERGLGQEGSETTFSEAPDAPTFGDASATFATRRPVGAGELTAGGFHIYARVGAIVPVVDIESIPDMPLSGATRLMNLQVSCIEEQGCAGPATLPGQLFGGADEVASEGADQAGAPAESAPGSVIIVEGDQSAPEATREPRSTREPRNRDATEVPAG